MCFLLYVGIERVSIGDLNMAHVYTVFLSSLQGPRIHFYHGICAVAVVHNCNYEYWIIYFRFLHR